MRFQTEFCQIAFQPPMWQKFRLVEAIMTNLLAHWCFKATFVIFSRIENPDAICLELFQHPIQSHPTFSTTVLHLFKVTFILDQQSSWSFFRLYPFNPCNKCKIQLQSIFDSPSQWGGTQLPVRRSTIIDRVCMMSKYQMLLTTIKAVFLW